MILSFSHKFAFVAVPRTGTHAVREHLRPHLAGSDWEQCARYERRAFPVPALAALRHGHLTAGQVQPHLVPGLWDTLYTFGFVRDPLDRFLSCCFFLHRKSDAMERAPAQTMATMLEKAREASQLLLKPQWPLLCSEAGAPMVNHIARYENYAAEFDAIASKIGLHARMKRVVNASPRNRAVEIPKAIKDGVAQAYSRDYELFGYDLP